MRRETGKEYAMRPVTGLLALGFLVFVTYNVLYSPLGPPGAQWRESAVSTQPLSFPPGHCREHMRTVGGTQQGGRIYGSWEMCDWGIADVQRPVVVYSFGLGHDITFEHQLLREHPHLQLYAFDPTPSSKVHVLDTIGKWPQEMRDRFHHHIFGLGDQDEQATFYLPAKATEASMTIASFEFLRPGSDARPKYTAQLHRFDTIMRMMNHTVGPDVLKIDIEGAEFKFLESVAESKGHLLGGTNQIMLEFHLWTKEAKVARNKLYDQLAELGFSRMGADPNFAEQTLVRS